MRTWAFLLMVAGLTFGCDDEPEMTAEPETTAEPQAPTQPDRVKVTLHEWGLISDRLGEGELVALSHRPIHRTLVHADGTRPPGMGLTGLGRGGGKPIIYAHLPEGAEEAVFSVTVRPVDGRIVEHWPLTGAVGTAQTVTWSDVHVRASVSECERRYPGGEEEPCASVPDAFCEAATLANAETHGSCLRVGDASADHLFYRAILPRRPLPLEVTVGDDGTVSVRNVGEHLIPGRLLRISRAARHTDAKVLVLAAPGPGAGITVASPDGAADAVGAEGALAALRTDLSRAGLTEQEVHAFVASWREELVGGAPSGGTIGLRPPTLGELGSPEPQLPPSLAAPEDALLYLMPKQAIDAHIQLEGSETVEAIERAMVVRVGLSYATDH